MFVDKTTYQQYLKLRHAHYHPVTALDAWRQIKHQQVTAVKRKLSTTFSKVYLELDISQSGLFTITFFGADYGVEIKYLETYWDDPFEGIGKIKRRRSEYPDHERNDAYWYIDSNTLFVPGETWIDRYKYYLPKYGKARARDMALAWRAADIKWLKNMMRDGPETEVLVTIELPDDEGEDQEFFSADELTSIYDWVASKIDSAIAQRQRQAA